MSEHEGGDGKMGAFLLGFLVGVLVCLGGGGVFFVVQSRQAAAMAAEAQMMRQQAEAARHEAEAARKLAEVERERAEKALEAEKQAKAERGN